MPVTIIPLGLAGTVKIIRDATSNATSENNVTDGAATIYAITVDNTANGVVEYTKLYNNAAPTVGTTDPDVILMTTLSAVRTYVFRNSLNMATALSFATVTAGGTAGVTNPVSTVIVNIVTG